MSRLDDLIAEHCPDGVPYVDLGSLLDVVPKIKWSESGEKEFPYIDLTAVDRSTHAIGATDTITAETAPGRAQQIVRDGDILFGTTRPMLKRYSIVPVRFDGAICSTGFCVLRPLRRRLLTSFLFHLLGTADFYAFVEANQRGASYPAIPDGVVKSFKVPLPPLEVQRAIANALDNFTELHSELEAELKARRRQYQYYRSHILDFSDDTQRVLLKDVIDFFNAKPHERLVDPAGEVALMTSKFISTEGREARYVPAAAVLSPALKNDVALVMSDLPNGRALAKAFFVEETGKYAANQRVCLLRVKNEAVFLPRFLFYVINRNSQLLAYDSGIDQTHLKKDHILNVVLPKPEISEQRKIVSILDKFDALLNDPATGVPVELAARRKQYGYYLDRILSFHGAAS